jgi:hypothetical protein
MSDATENPFKFNWHHSANEFLRWLLPTLLVGNDAQLKELAEKTNRWSNVELTVLINDVAVDATHFIEGLQRTIDVTTQDAARKFVTETLNLNSVVESLENFGHAIQREINDRARELGVDLTDADGF